MIKKRKVSLVKLMMNYWLSIPGLKGSVTCTSWVTHLVNNLGMLENANVTFIDTPRWILGYTFFNKSHMLKKGENGNTVMMYKSYTEYKLPDQTLGLYVVENFVFELQKPGPAVGRSTSAHFIRNQNPRYQGEDTAPLGPTFTSYFGFDQVGPSQAHHLG
jgi:hypothetical protein